MSSVKSLILIVTLPPATSSTTAILSAAPMETLPTLLKLAPSTDTDLPSSAILSAVNVEAPTSTAPPNEPNVGVVAEPSLRSSALLTVPAAAANTPSRFTIAFAPKATPLGLITQTPPAVPFIIPSICDFPAAPSTRLKNVEAAPLKDMRWFKPILNFVQSSTPTGDDDSNVSASAVFSDIVTRVSFSRTAFPPRSDSPANAGRDATQSIAKAEIVATSLQAALRRRNTWNLKIPLFISLPSYLN